MFRNARFGEAAGRACRSFDPGDGVRSARRGFDDCAQLPLPGTDAGPLFRVPDLPELAMEVPGKYSSLSWKTCASSRPTREREVDVSGHVSDSLADD